MMDDNDLLTFFKAMADANRLKIVGLLARQSYTVEQLAAMLGLGASTVSHHLSRLSDAGLVTAAARSYYNYYQLKTERIEQVAHLLLAKETLPAVAGEMRVDNDAYDRKVFSHYLLPIIIGGLVLGIVGSGASYLLVKGFFLRKRHDTA